MANPPKISRAMQLLIPLIVLTLALNLVIAAVLVIALIGIGWGKHADTTATLKNESKPNPAPVVDSHQRTVALRTKAAWNQLVQIDLELQPYKSDDPLRFWEQNYLLSGRIETDYVDPELETLLSDRIHLSLDFARFLKHYSAERAKIVQGAQVSADLGETIGASGNDPQRGAAAGKLLFGMLGAAAANNELNSLDEQMQPKYRLLQARAKTNVDKQGELGEILTKKYAMPFKQKIVNSEGAGRQQGPPPQIKRAEAEPSEYRKSTGNAEGVASIVRRQKERESIENSLSMKLVYVPPGEYDMGSPVSEVGRGSDETLHRVQLTKGFYVGAYEVTQGEFERVMKQNPSHFSGSGAGKQRVSDVDTKRLPVEQVSWEDAQDFCRKLSALSDEAKRGRVYRLPTEAEWEYCCKAQTDSVFHFGDSLNGHEANCNGALPYGTNAKGSYREAPTIVGSFSPNPLGIYDLHGNVWEWCSDWHADYNGNETDPVGPRSGQHRVSRGGGWQQRAIHCRSAFRNLYEPATRSSEGGFRVVCQL